MSLVLSSELHCMYAAQPHSLAGNPSRPLTHLDVPLSSEACLSLPCPCPGYLCSACFWEQGENNSLRHKGFNEESPSKEEERPKTSPCSPPCLALLSHWLGTPPPTPLWKRGRGACPSAGSPQRSPTAPFTGACVCAGHPCSSGDGSLTHDQPVPWRPTATSYMGLCFCFFSSPSLSSSCHTWWHMVTSGWGWSVGNSRTTAELRQSSVPWV